MQKQWLGAYQLLEKISQDRLGTLYWAQSQQFSEPIWLKHFDSSCAQIPTLQSRFLDGMEQLQQISSPHLLRVYEAQSTPEGIIATFESSQPLSLAQSLSGLSIAPAYILQLMMQLFHILKELHQKSLLHGDIRSSSLFVSQTASDTPLLKVLHAGHLWWWNDQLRQSGGSNDDSIYFMSPEQFSGGGFDHRSEIYACAMLLAELFCGQSLAKIDNIQAQQNPENISYFTIEHIQSLQVIPENLILLLQHALQRDPSLRYQSIEQFSDCFYQAMLQADPSLHQIQLSSSNLASVTPSLEYDILLDALGSGDPLDATLVQPSPMERNVHLSASRSSWDSIQNSPPSNISLSSLPAPSFSSSSFDSPPPNSSKESWDGLPFQSNVNLPALSGKELHHKKMGSFASLHQLPAQLPSEPKESQMTSRRWLILLAVLLFSFMIVVFGTRTVNKIQTIPKEHVPVRYVLMELDSKPRGAEVWIDGKKHAVTTPATLTGVLGESKQIMLRKEGYKPQVFRWDILIKANKHIVLLKEKSIETTERKGIPSEPLKPKVQKEKVQVRKQQKTVRIARKSGKAKTFKKKKRRNKMLGNMSVPHYILSLKTNPSKATVVLKQLKVSGRSPLKIAIPKGKTFKISISKYGYQNSYAVWTASQNETKTIRLYKHSWHNP